jgi:hypothetical protein
MEHLIDQEHKLEDQEVEEHQETVQQVLVIHHLQTHLKVMVVVLVQVKDPLHLEKVAVEVELLNLVIPMDSLMEEMEHLI